MNHEPAEIMKKVVEVHAALKADDLAQLRSLTMEQRSALIVAACEAAVIIERDRVASGLPPSQPAPWPASTWKFLREHAARVRS